MIVAYGLMTIKTQPTGSSLIIHRDSSQLMVILELYQMQDSKKKNRDNANLILLPNLDEVKQATFSIDLNKTLGPDGFGVGFFKKYWHLIKKDLFNCILEFFMNGKILKEYVHYPKIDSPSQTNQFRPISLCSTMYKIIFKILVARLRPLLDKLISPYQSIFIPGRSIHDNILLTTKSCINSRT